MAAFTSTDEPLRELALFAGAGGGILGGMLLGWRTVCAVECDAYAASVLVARQNDGILEPFPIWDDVRTFDGRAWRGRVDVVSGGFPCQDISAAGKGAGIDGEQSGLWREMARIIGEVRPRFAFVENSPVLTSRGLDRVLGDLAGMGYDSRWGVVSAAAIGAPHIRERVWIVARNHGAGDERRYRRRTIHRSRDGAQQERGASCVFKRGNRLLATRLGAFDPDTASVGLEVREWVFSWSEKANTTATAFGWWCDLPERVRMVDVVACRMERIMAIGNGQVPCVAALAWRILTEE